MKSVKRASMGFGFLFDGYKTVMADKWLKRFSLVPLIIAAACFIVGFVYGANQIPDLVDAAMSALFGQPGEGFWSYVVAFFRLLVELLTFFVFAALLLYVVFLSASVLASPFNSLIAEKVLAQQGLVPDRPFELKRWSKTAGRMFVISLGRALILGMFAPVLLVAGAIPGLNVVASYIAFVFLAFDSADFSLEVLEYGLAERFRYLKANLPEFSGMAGALGLTAFVPGMTILLLPVSVAGATRVVARLEKQKRLTATQK